MKRIIAALIAMLIMATSTPVSAASTNEQREAEKLFTSAKEAGIVKNDFDFSKSLTRGEYIQILLNKANNSYKSVKAREEDMEEIIVDTIISNHEKVDIILDEYTCGKYAKFSYKKSPSTRWIEVVTYITDYHFKLGFFADESNVFDLSDAGLKKWRKYRTGGKKLTTLAKKAFSSFRQGSKITKIEGLYIVSLSP